MKKKKEYGSARIERSLMIKIKEISLSTGITVKDVTDMVIEMGLKGSKSYFDIMKKKTKEIREA